MSKVVVNEKYEKPALDSPRSIMQVDKVFNCPPKFCNSENTIKQTQGCKKKLKCAGHLFRFFFLDVPLMILFTLFISTTMLYELALEYYIPQIKLMQWDKKRQMKELTYYNRVCGMEDITTNNTTDLIIREDMDAHDCMEHMLKHGVSLYSNLISNETAKAARNYILERNQIEKGWFVIENENRYSFGVDVNSHPSIQQALKEISQNKKLEAALEKILGPNPAIVEFTGITSLYGATDQFMHQDVLPKGSAFKYARNFAPTYSLFIPLQDTTAEMGSTSICPGTHQCSGIDINSICEAGGAILVSGEDSWKSGTGALVNQQTFHRGTAHIDEHGPDRVLFILTFVSRPRFGRNQVETRMIGQGGSYSLKWNQWGHTLKDFSNPSKYMSQPWKTLRSLGVFKSSGHDWGWDYISVASMRIANDDVGYTRYNLEEFVDEGGFTFLPNFLMPELTEEDHWVTYLEKTIGNVEEWLEEKVFNVHITYLAVLAISNVILLLSGFGEKGNIFARGLGRLLLTHGSVVVLTLAVWYHVGATQWAKNIRSGLAFNTHRSYEGIKQPATIPHEMDVLKTTRMNSPFLASYQHIHEVNHPGNHQWENTIRMNSFNYHNLPKPVKLELVKMVVTETKMNHGSRLLRQTDDSSRWVVMSEEESWHQAHIDLSKKSNDIMYFTLTILEYFEAELTVGIFRETALHKRHIVELLEKLRDSITGILATNPMNSSVTHFPSIQPMIRRSLLRSSLSNISCSNISFRTKQFSVRTLPDREETSTHSAVSWIQEGDIVEGQYKGQYNEWYRAKVVKVNANKGKIDIAYFDGEKDKGLCRRCVRPYNGFSINEAVSIPLKGKFYNGYIVRDLGNDEYNVKTKSKGLRKKVKGHLIRRTIDREVLKVESIVEARFYGSDKFFSGRIRRENEDGTFAVIFEDGDSDYSVPPEHIRLL